MQGPRKAQKPESIPSFTQGKAGGDLWGMDKPTGIIPSLPGLPQSHGEHQVMIMPGELRACPPSTSPLPQQNVLQPLSSLPQTPRETILDPKSLYQTSPSLHGRANREPQVLPEPQTSRCLFPEPL